MGQFKLEIVAVGGHGCQREIKDGGRVLGCGRQGCPDCEFFSLVADYVRRTGVNLLEARQTHWPDTSGQVVDVFSQPLLDGAPVQSYPRLPRQRLGSFS